MLRSKSGHADRGVTVLFGLLVMAGVLQFTAIPARALISESFEGGWGAWTWNYNYDVAFFGGSISSLHAHGGIYSAKLDCHGLPQPTYPRMTVWIVRPVQVRPLTTVNVDVDFWLMSNGTSGVSAQVLAYLDVPRPLDYSDFIPVGQTEEAMGWVHYSYSNSFLSGPTGVIYAAVGYWNPRTGLMAGFFDSVNLTGVSADWTPPTITNLQPTNSSIIGNNKPLVGASYSDASGIDASSVLLKVDSADVTGFSTVTAADVRYTPQTALTEGLHTAYVEVKDNSDNHNKATETWRFTVDTLPPSVTNIQPVNRSTIGDRVPYIAADYDDASGVNASTVVLRVDGVDVTSSATVTVNGMSFIPSTAMFDGLHTVYLTLSDKSNPANRAVVTWSFTIDSTPPAITNLQPAGGSTAGLKRPRIGASYSDSSGIALSSVILMIDSVNVTGLSLVGLSDVGYTPSADLAEGRHDVYLEVKDDSDLHLKASRIWFFYVDTLGPTIMNLRPVNGTVLGTGTPTIGANYDDVWGINTTTVKLKVDSADVTPSSVVTASGVTYTPSVPLSDGKHDVYLEVRDASPGANLGTASWSFVTDTSPPTTVLAVGSPNCTDMGSGKTYISSQTRLTLTADDHDGGGVQSIKFLYYASGETEPAYTTYNLPFSIPASKADGLVIVKLKSIDTFGNEETPRTVELYLDNTPPAKDVPGWDPVQVTYTNNALASISVQVDDGTGSGVGNVKYGIDGQLCPLAYTGAIIADRLGEGLHRFYFKAWDKIGNAEAEEYIEVFLDTIAPTAVAGNDTRVDPGTTVHFDGSESSDNPGGSGIVNYTWTIDYQGVPYTRYGVAPSFAFVEKGVCVVTLDVRDRANNTNSIVMTVTVSSSGGDGGTGSASAGDLTVLILAVVLIVAVVLAILLLILLKRRKKDETKEKEKDAEE